MEIVSQADYRGRLVARHDLDQSVLPELNGHRLGRDGAGRGAELQEVAVERQIASPRPASTGMTSSSSVVLPEPLQPHTARTGPAGGARGGGGGFFRPFMAGG